MSLKKLLLEQINEEEKKSIFNREVAQTQRGKPESVMLKAQKIMGGGVMSYLVEHVGDITHRMAEEVTYSNGGYEFVEPKVKRAVKMLNSGYGFEREFKENIESNARYHDDDPKDLMRETKKVLKEYADAHSRIPVYNRMQWLARQSAVELGLMNYDKAKKHLEELEKHIDKGREHWIEVAHQFEENYEPK